jgi:pre-mRNA-processing factor 19
MYLKRPVLDIHCISANLRSTATLSRSKFFYYFRVIARLTKEVTAAREALATLKPQASIAAPAAVPAVAAVAPQVMTAAMTEASGMTQDIVDKLQDKAKVLTGERRKRSKMVPEDLVTPENIRSFRTIASHPGKSFIQLTS